MSILVLQLHPSCSWLQAADDMLSILRVAAKCNSSSLRTLRQHHCCFHISVSTAHTLTCAVGICNRAYLGHDLCISRHASQLCAGEEVLLTQQVHCIHSDRRAVLACCLRMLNSRRQSQHVSRSTLSTSLSESQQHWDKFVNNLHSWTHSTMPGTGQTAAFSNFLNQHWHNWLKHDSYPSNNAKTLDFSCNTQC